MGYTTEFEGALSISPPITTEHRKIINDFALEDHRYDKEPVPGYYCQWVVDDLGRLEWDGGEKFYEYVEWLRYLVVTFFEPWGYTLEGKIRWRGEEFNDNGTIFVADNVVTTDGRPGA